MARMVRRTQKGMNMAKKPTKPAPAKKATKTLYYQQADGSFTKTKPKGLTADQILAKTKGKTK